MCNNFIINLDLQQLTYWRSTNQIIISNKTLIHSVSNPRMRFEAIDPNTVKKELNQKRYPFCYKIYLGYPLS